MKTVNLENDLNRHRTRVSRTLTNGDTITDQKWGGRDDEMVRIGMFSKFSDVLLERYHTTATVNVAETWKRHIIIAKLVIISIV